MKFDIGDLVEHINPHRDKVFTLGLVIGYRDRSTFPYKVLWRYGEIVSHHGHHLKLIQKVEK